MLISRTIHSEILAIGVDTNLFVIFRRVFTVSTNYPPCIEMEKVKVGPSCGRATLVDIREWLLLEKSCNNNKKVMYTTLVMLSIDQPFSRSTSRRSKTIFVCTEVSTFILIQAV